MLRQLLAIVLLTTGGAAFAALPPVVNGYEQHQPISVNQTAATGVVGLYKKVQRLEQEVQQLLGRLEEQSYLIESLQKRQRDLYLDTDRRMQALEQGGVASVPVAVNQDHVAADSISQVPQKVQIAQDGQAKLDYNKAFASLKAGNFSQAIAGFANFEKTHPTSRYMPNALYWHGEASYVSRDFKQAELEFKKVLAQYPNHSKAKDALLKLSFIQYENKQWKQARQNLQKVIKDYPSATVAQLARKRLDLMNKETR